MKLQALLGDEALLHTHTIQIFREANSSNTLTSVFPSLKVPHDITRNLIQDSDEEGSMQRSTVQLHTVKSTPRLREKKPKAENPRVQAVNKEADAQIAALELKNRELQAKLKK